MSAPVDRAFESDGFLIRDLEGSTGRHAGYFSGAGNAETIVPDAPLGSVYLRTDGFSFRLVALPGSSGANWAQIPLPTVAGNQAIASAYRTTVTPELTASFVDIPLPTVILQNQTGVVERDPANTDRFLLKENGPYEITTSFDATLANQSSGSAEVLTRVTLNDVATALPGSAVEFTVLDDSSLSGDEVLRNTGSRTFPLNVTTAPVFITLQAAKRDQSGSSVTATGRANGVIMTVKRLSGQKGDAGPQGVPGSGQSTIRTGHTYAISGNIVIPAGQTNFINPFFVSLAGGQVSNIVKCRHRINAGTSATVKLTRNGIDIPGYTGIAVTTTAADTAGGTIALANNDVIALVVTGISGTPQNLSFTIFIESTN